MTSATIRPDSGAGGRHAEGRGLGLIVFASILLFVARLLQHALRHRRDRQLARLHRQRPLRVRQPARLGLDHPHHRHPAAGRRGRGVAGNQLARWFAVAVVGLSAIDMMFFVPAYPFWALTIIAVDVVALYALCAYGSRENLAGV